MTPIAGRLMLSCPVLLTLSVTSTEYNKAQQGAHRDSIQNQPSHVSPVGSQDEARLDMTASNGGMQ